MKDGTIHVAFTAKMDSLRSQLENEGFVCHKKMSPQCVAAVVTAPPKHRQENIFYVYPAEPGQFKAAKGNANFRQPIASKAIGQAIKNGVALRV